MPKLSQLPSAPTVATSDLVPVDTGSPPITQAATVGKLQSIIILSRDQDQLVFERALSSNGATFNGTADDAPALQASLNSLGADNKLHKVSLESGALQGVIGSVNTCPYASSVGATNCGLQIPANVALDFNLATLTVSAVGGVAIGSNGAAVAIVGNSGLSNSFSLVPITYKDGFIVGVSSISYALLLRNTAADTGPARTTFNRMTITGSYNGVWSESNSYLVTFNRCRLKSNGGNSFHMAGSGTNGGENINFFATTFDSQSTAGSAGIRINTPPGGFTSISCHACSFDFNTQAVRIDSGSTGTTAIGLHGCHLECRKLQAGFPGTLGAYVKISDTATLSNILMVGGDILVDNSGSGNTLAYMFDSGNTASAAPYGISLYGVSRTLNGVSLYNPASTGFFSDISNPLLVG